MEYPIPDGEVIMDWPHVGHQRNGFIKGFTARQEMDGWKQVAPDLKPEIYLVIDYDWHDRPFEAYYLDGVWKDNDHGDIVNPTHYFIVPKPPIEPPKQ